MMQIALFDGLCEDAAAIRREVFMAEQGFVNEFDHIDNIARHIVLYVDNVAAATCRFYPAEDRYIIGRIATRKRFRRQGLGLKLLAAAEAEIKAAGGTCIQLGAQKEAQAFYEKAGYKSNGKEFLDEHCPHIWMCKLIK